MKFTVLSSSTPEIGRRGTLVWRDVARWPTIRAMGRRKCLAYDLLEGKTIQCPPKLATRGRNAAVVVAGSGAQKTLLPD